MAEDVSETKIQWGTKGTLPNIPPRWNGCPTQDFGVVRWNSEDKARSLDAMRWGLVPAWSKDEKPSFNTINARCETVTTSGAFRDPWKKGKRCIIPVQGFYEWKKLDAKTKQPYLITRADKELLALAGLWEGKKLDGGELLRTFTIITTEANEFMSQVHDRMPVILSKADAAQWIGEEAASDEALTDLMKPSPNEWLAKVPVDPRMGNSRNQGEEFCQPINSL